MKILVVCQYYYPENVVITPVCEELVRRGHAVTVVTGQPNYGFGRIVPGYENVVEEVINGVVIHRVRLVPRTKGKLSLIRNYLSFNRHANSFMKKFDGDFDLVYSMELSPITAVECADIYAKRHQIPHLLHCLDLWPESVVATGAFKKESWAYKKLFKWSRSIYNGADKILVSSPSFASYFKDVLHLDKEIAFVPQPPLVSDPQGKPFVYPQKFNFLYAGNIGNLQLVEQFVLAAKDFVKRPDFGLYIIGSGARAEAVQALIKANGLEKTVHYHERMSPEEVAAYYPNATALIVPLAQSESPVSKTIPNKLISSLYWGKPIVACLQGDGADVLKKANGSLFAGEAPKEISKVFSQMMLLSPEKRTQMGQSNRKYFNDNFEFGKVIDQLEGQFNLIKKD